MPPSCSVCGRRDGLGPDVLFHLCPRFFFLPPCSHNTLPCSQFCSLPPHAHPFALFFLHATLHTILPVLCLPLCPLPFVPSMTIHFSATFPLSSLPVHFTFYMPTVMPCPFSFSTHFLPAHVPFCLAHMHIFPPELNSLSAFWDLLHLPSFLYFILFIHYSLIFIILFIYFYFIMVYGLGLVCLLACPC